MGRAVHAPVHDAHLVQPARDHRDIVGSITDRSDHLDYRSRCMPRRIAGIPGFYMYL